MRSWMNDFIHYFYPSLHLYFSSWLRICTDQRLKFSKQEKARRGLGKKKKNDCFLLLQLRLDLLKTEIFNGTKN